MPAAAAETVFMWARKDTHLLVDAGISGKRIEQGLNELELTTKDMDGILVTHEHVGSCEGAGGAGAKIRNSHLRHGGHHRRT